MNESVKSVEQVVDCRQKKTFRVLPLIEEDRKPKGGKKKKGKEKKLRTHFISNQHTHIHTNKQTHLQITRITVRRKTVSLS